MSLQTGFQVQPLPAARFAHLYGRSDADLASNGVIAKIADTKPGFPCRVTLRDAEPGERVLLMNFEHQPAETPFRSSHAIYVIDGGKQTHVAPGDVPELMARRLLSVRAFSHDDMIVDADVVDGREAASLFERLLARPDTAYLHAHYARLGCYAAQIDRA